MVKDVLPSTMPAHDLTYIATYTQIELSVKFFDDDTAQRHRPLWRKCNTSIGPESWLYLHWLECVIPECPIIDRYLYQWTNQHLYRHL